MMISAAEFYYFAVEFRVLGLDQILLLIGLFQFFAQSFILLRHFEYPLVKLPQDAVVLRRDRT